MIYLLCILPISLQYTYKDVQESDRKLQVHLHSPSIIKLPDARDAIIVSYNNSKDCEIKPLRLKFETQEFRIIQEQDFKEQDFESDTTLNFRQFVSMIHIKDGMMAITSDSIAYMLKFNYDTVFEHDFQESGTQFARIMWKADLQTIAPTITAKNELPQLLYAPSSNLAFLLFSDSAQLFSMSQMETQSRSIDVYQVTDWRKRGYRGLTKEMDGLLYSVVGRDGIDIYRVVEKDLRFIKNLKLKDFGLNTTIEIVDFSIVKHGPTQGYYSLFLLDRESGLLLIDVHSDQNVNFGLRSWINYQNGGISVDTRNGCNVFMAYQQLGHHYVIEYNVNLDNGNSFIVRKKKIDHRIIDLDATEEFVIVQGVNQHLILFSNGYDYVMTHHKDQVFKHLGLRDFEFFNQSYKIEDLQDLSQEYKYSDFFFGITAQSAFLTRFQIEPVQISCLYHQMSDQIYSYTVQYNTTLENISDLVIRHTMQLHVQVLQTYLFETEQYLLYSFLFLFGSLIMMGIGYGGYWFYARKKQYTTLMEQIEKTQRERGVSKSGFTSTIKGDETSVFQVQNKSIAP